MKKQFYLRALLGFPMGVFVGYTVTVFLSLFFGPGEYLPAEPSLIASMGGEVPAVAVQYLLCGLLGAGFAVGTLIWEMERWSIAKRTGIHLLLVSLLMLPVAYLMHWMPHNLPGVMLYVLIFVGIYVVIWATQYFAWMRKVQAINRRLRGQ